MPINNRPSPPPPPPLRLAPEQTTLPAEARRELSAALDAVSNVGTMLGEIVRALGEEDVHEFGGAGAGEWDPGAGARGSELAARWALGTGAYLFNCAISHARLADLYRSHGDALPSEAVSAAWGAGKEAEGRLRELAAELGLGATP